MNNCVMTIEELRRIAQFLESYEARDVVEAVCRQQVADRLAVAEVVPVQELPRSVVSMYSVVKVVDLSQREAFNYTLVYPGSAREFDASLSLLSPAGAALLGAREGTTVTYHDGDATVSLAIKEVLYQPEWEQTNRFTHRRFSSTEAGRPLA